ncbi:hypothetical protein D3C80_1694150 [compost metagenome]
MAAFLLWRGSLRRHEANRLVNLGQRFLCARTSLGRTVTHHLLQQGLVIAETVVTLLQLTQHAGYRFGYRTFQVAVHLAFKLGFQLSDALAGHTGENIQQV